MTLEPSEKTHKLSFKDGFTGGEVLLKSGMHNGLYLVGPSNGTPTIIKNVGGKAIIENFKRAIRATDGFSNLSICGDGDENHYYGIRTQGGWGIEFSGSSKNLSINNVEFDMVGEYFGGIVPKTDKNPNNTFDYIYVRDVITRNAYGEGGYIGQSTAKTEQYHRYKKVNALRWLVPNSGREAFQTRHIDSLVMDKCNAHNAGMRNIKNQRFNSQFRDTYGIIKNCIFDISNHNLLNLFTTGLTFENCLFYRPKEAFAYFGKNDEYNDAIETVGEIVKTNIVFNKCYFGGLNENEPMFKLGSIQENVELNECIFDYDYPVKTDKETSKIMFNDCRVEEFPAPEYVSSDDIRIKADSYFGKLVIGANTNDIVYPNEIVEPPKDYVIYKGDNYRYEEFNSSEGNKIIQLKEML